MKIIILDKEDERYSEHTAESYIDLIKYMKDEVALIVVRIEAFVNKDEDEDFTKELVNKVLEKLKKNDY